MNEEEREALRARAEQLEENAIQVAEAPRHHHIQVSDVARAELGLKIAAILRDRAETYAA